VHRSHPKRWRASNVSLAPIFARSWDGRRLSAKSRAESWRSKWLGELPRPRKRLSSGLILRYSFNLRRRAGVFRPTARTKYSCSRLRRPRRVQFVPRFAPAGRFRFMCRRSPSCRPPRNERAAISRARVLGIDQNYTRTADYEAYLKQYPGGSSSASRELALRSRLNCGRARSAGPRRQAVV
jgi:hypothetical protein